MLATLEIRRGDLHAGHLVKLRNAFVDGREDDLRVVAEDAGRRHRVADSSRELLPVRFFCCRRGAALRKALWSRQDEIEMERNRAFKARFRLAFRVQAGGADVLPPIREALAAIDEHAAANMAL